MTKTRFTRPISVAQHNAYRSNASVTTALQLSDVDLLLVTEPWWGAIGDDNMGEVRQPGYTTLLPVQSVPEGRRPRVMAYVRERDDFQVVARLDMVQDLDYQVLEVRQKPHPPILIYHVYNQAPQDADDADPPEHLIWTLQRLTDLPVPDAPHLFTGDFNLHHSTWDSSCRRSSALAGRWADWVGERNYLLLNDPEEPMFFSRDGTSSSVIDLTWLSPALEQLDVVRDWHVDPGKAWSSDHAGVLWTIDHGATHIDDPLELRYNFKHADPEKWQKAFTAAVHQRRARFAPLSGAALPTTDELDDAAFALDEAFQEATKTTVPERRPSKHSKPWWTPELSETVAAFHAQAKAAWAFAREHGRASEELNAQVAGTLNYLKRAIRKTKRDFYSQKAREATPSDAYKMRKWGRGIREYPSPSIQMTGGRGLAHEHEDKCNAIREELFQPAPDLPGVPEPDLTTPHPDDRPMPSVSIQDVRDAIFGASTKSAPGDDLTSYQLLRWAWTARREEIYLLVTKCIVVGHHCSRWKSSIAVTLRKADDDEIFDFTCVSRQHYRAKTHAGNRAPEPSIHESITQE